ncbi:hypothetical protein AAVH_01067 [Aphelenchoides avenae]|nr:hypothetical protein AAVH_01067 [Aphelenchus avenae]
MHVQLKISDKSANRVNFGGQSYRNEYANGAGHCSSNASSSTGKRPEPSTSGLNRSFRVPAHESTAMIRSQSVDSKNSSGHGGSSAMSSAEGIGGLGEVCQIEYVQIQPNTALPFPVTGADEKRKRKP